MLRTARRRLAVGGLAVLGAAALTIGLIGTSASGEIGAQRDAVSGNGNVRASVSEVRARGKRAKRPMLAVSNNWDGTVDLVDPRTFKQLEHINVVPDLQERQAEVLLKPGGPAFYLAIREAIGEGHDQLADDAFASPNGRRIYVSRPSLADVVAISLKTEKIVWQTEVEGYRSDHMAISEDGRELLVSDSTEAKVQVINTRRGKIVDTFPSGDTPHESNYSADGKRIYHASIGTVYTPLDQPEFDTSKGERIFEIVNARTKKVIKTYDMGVELDKAGFPDMSSAVRPMTLSPNERFVYFQVSFFHGFVEFDLKRERVRRVRTLPQSQEAQETPREEYLLDSAHHGIAMNPQGTKLCVAATMSDYAAIVNRRKMRFERINLGDDAKPYWSTPSENGRYCFVSISGRDRVAVISYRTGEKVAQFKVGDHPQRMRTGVVRRAFVR